MDHPPHIIITSKESQMQSKSAFNIISQHDKDKMEDASTESARCTTETENQPLGNPDGKTLGPKTKASEGEAFVVQLHQLKQITTRRFSIHADRSGKPLLKLQVLQVSTVPLSKFQSHFLRSSKSIHSPVPLSSKTLEDVPFTLSFFSKVRSCLNIIIIIIIIATTTDSSAKYRHAGVW
jgi:hypothetical protein